MDSGTTGVPRARAAGHGHAARQLDGWGFVDAARPGDQVPVHWSWACEVLEPPALARLRAVTARCRELANLTV